MGYRDFVLSLHRRGQRNYLERVCEHDKAECASVAKQYGRDYWDGDRKYGYGGYHYDGRWSQVAKEMIAHYGIRGGERILDVGCGRGFLLHEFKQLLPDVEVCGIDISNYALRTAKPEVAPFLQEAVAQSLPFEDSSFDLVLSLGTLHNLRIFDLRTALFEITRVQRDPERAYIMVESYRNEQERTNLLYWQLTCESFYSVEEWEWIYRDCHYAGDYSFIFFE